MQARRFWQLVLLVLITVVCVLALTPAPPKTMSLGWDKLNHAAAFTALAVTGCLGFAGRRRAKWGVVLALLAFGGLIEILQASVPGRAGEWADLLADGVGIACGAGLAWLAWRVVGPAKAD